MTTAEYAAMQDRIRTIYTLAAATDDEALGEFIREAEHADTVAPLLDPTLWLRGRDQLALVIRHARALAAFKKAVQP